MEDRYAPARLALYSLRIGNGGPTYYGTKVGISALIEAIELDAALVDQAAAEKFLRLKDAKWIWHPETKCGIAVTTKNVWKLE